MGEGLGDGVEFVEEGNGEGVFIVAGDEEGDGVVFVGVGGDAGVADFNSGAHLVGIGLI